MERLKIRSREPQEAFVRAIYAEMLLDRAEQMLGTITHPEVNINDIENPNESLSPSAYNLRCYQSSFEEEIIHRDLFHRLSAEAKQVLAIFANTPAEITEALLDICVAHERGNPRKYCKRKSILYIYKPERVKNYLRRFRGWSRQKVERAFAEVSLFIKETMI